MPEPAWYAGFFPSGKQKPAASPGTLMRPGCCPEELAHLPPQAFQLLPLRGRIRHEIDTGPVSEELAQQAGLPHSATTINGNKLKSILFVPFLEERQLAVSIYKFQDIPFSLIIFSLILIRLKNAFCQAKLLLFNAQPLREP
mgnify:CR=1 FL=1